MALLLKPASEPAANWVAQFHQLAPDLEVRVWPELGDPADIEYVLVANLPFGQLAQLPNLKLIVSLPVGLDHLLNDPELPQSVPITRCVMPDGDPMMTEFVLLHVLRHHRQLPSYAAFQLKREWHPLPQTQVATKDRRIGIMGLGTFGAAAAAGLRDHGFTVAGWSRRSRSIAGVETFAGSEQFQPFLARTDILVCMLPATAETKGLLNRQAFAALPDGAQVINVSRGSILVEADLIDALDSGHLNSATLDVTSVEPLPSDSPLWSHPGITVTPHVASVVRSGTSAPIVAENIRRARTGEPLLNPVDLEAGY